MPLPSDGPVTILIYVQFLGYSLPASHWRVRSSLADRIGGTNKCHIGGRSRPSASTSIYLCAKKIMYIPQIPERRCLQLPSSLAPYTLHTLFSQVYSIWNAEIHTFDPGRGCCVHQFTAFSDVIFTPPGRGHCVQHTFGGKRRLSNLHFSTSVPIQFFIVKCGHERSNLEYK